MYNKSNTITTCEYKNIPLLASDGFLIPILDRIHHLLEFMLNKHSQVLLVRFDVRFVFDEKKPNDNSIFQGFIENYRRYLDRQEFDPHLIWVREQGKGSVNCHYHLALLLNGNRIRYFKECSKGEELWARALNIPYIRNSGLIHICKAGNLNSVMIRRGDMIMLEKSYKWLSYMAKTDTKDDIPKNVKMFSSSQIPKIF